MSKVSQVFRLIVAGLLVCLGGRGVFAAGLEADMVIYNGKVLTANGPDPENFAIAQAAAIYDGKFVAVGTNDEVLQYAGPSTRKIDLGGRTVLPGLIDTHDHIHSYSAHFFPEGRQYYTDPPLTWTSKDEGLAQLRTLALRKKPGEWIRTTIRGGGAAGFGSLDSIGVALAIQKGELTRYDLDKVTPNNPVRITNIFFSPTGDSLVNTKALQPLLDKYPNIPGVRLDAKRVPTGWLSGTADRTIEYEFYPRIPPEKLAPYYRMEMEEVAAQGLTTVSSRIMPDDAAAYAWLNVRGELPVRMAYSSEAPMRSMYPEALLSRLGGLQGGLGKEMWGLGDDKVWVIGVAATFSIDSISNIAGACVRNPYPREALNFPLWKYQLYGPNGLCRLVDPNYKDLDSLRAAAQYGFRSSATHASGDLSIDQYLDALEEIAKEYPHVIEQRWGVDHCNMLHEEQILRAKKLNIIFSCMAMSLYNGLEATALILKDEEKAGDISSPFRRLLDHGVGAVMELDRHAFHPMLALEVVVTRKDINGKVWGPQQRINRREALYTYTRWAAEYVLREGVLGSIEPKKYADFVVLDRDYLAVPEDEIGQIDPLLVVMGGKMTYTEPAFAASMGLPQVGYRGDRSYWLRGIPEDKNRGR